MIVLNQNPLFVGAARDISRALGSHIVYSKGRVFPGDMTGRNILAWKSNYRTPLQVKLAQVWDDDTQQLVKDLDTLTDVVSLIAFHRTLPLNPYGRDYCEGTQQLSLTNMGKYFPLDKAYEATTTDFHFIAPGTRTGDFAVVPAQPLPDADTQGAATDDAGSDAQGPSDSQETDPAAEDAADPGTASGEAAEEPDVTPVESDPEPVGADGEESQT